MELFEEEIRKIARRTKSPISKDVVNVESLLTSESAIQEVMNILYRQVESAVSVYNEESRNDELSLYKFHEKIAQLLMGVNECSSSFCVISQNRFVVFLEDNPDHVVVVGKDIKKNGTKENLLSRARQLIRLSFEKAEGEYLYRDNTSARIDSREVIVLIINWL